ncbi:hypothetical protein HDV05_006029 [Chytridiales sp. JEL 0842]|nr:hypothetical protein HDV05_006029 [Chytridiales sp. JEL 0842]
MFSEDNAVPLVTLDNETLLIAEKDARKRHSKSVAQTAGGAVRMIFSPLSVYGLARAGLRGHKACWAHQDILAEVQRRGLTPLPVGGDESRYVLAAGQIVTLAAGETIGGALANHVITPALEGWASAAGEGVANAAVHGLSEGKVVNHIVGSQVEHAVEKPLNQAIVAGMPQNQLAPVAPSYYTPYLAKFRQPRKGPEHCTEHLQGIWKGWGGDHPAEFSQPAPISPPQESAFQFQSAPLYDTRFLTGPIPSSYTSDNSPLSSLNESSVSNEDRSYLTGIPRSPSPFATPRSPSPLSANNTTGTLTYMLEFELWIQATLVTGRNLVDPRNQVTGTVNPAGTHMTLKEVMTDTNGIVTMLTTRMEEQSHRTGAPAPNGNRTTRSANGRSSVPPSSTSSSSTLAATSSVAPTSPATTLSFLRLPPDIWHRIGFYIIGPTTSNADNALLHLTNASAASHTLFTSPLFNGLWISAFESRWGTWVIPQRMSLGYSRQSFYSSMTNPYKTFLIVVCKLGCPVCFGSLAEVEVGEGVAVDQNGEVLDSQQPKTLTTNGHYHHKHDAKEKVNGRATDYNNYAVYEGDSDSDSAKRDALEAFINKILKPSSWSSHCPCCSFNPEERIRKFHTSVAWKCPSLMDPDDHRIFCSKLCGDPEPQLECTGSCQDHGCAACFLEGGSFVAADPTSAEGITGKLWICKEDDDDDDLDEFNDEDEDGLDFLNTVSVPGSGFGGLLSGIIPADELVVGSGNSGSVSASGLPNEVGARQVSSGARDDWWEKGARRCRESGRFLHGECICGECDIYEALEAGDGEHLPFNE